MSRLIRVSLSRTSQLENKKKKVLVHFPKWDMTLFCSEAHVMQTQQSFSSLSTPGSRWRCCLSWCWSKIRCTLTEPSGPTPGHQGWGGAGSHLTETPVWASCRRTENKMPPCERFSSGQTAGWRGRLWRERQSSKLQGLCRWSVPSLCCSRPVRWAWSCQSGPRRRQWGVKSGPRRVWRWRLIWGPLHTLLAGPSPLSLLGHLCPRSDLALLSHLERKRSTDMSIHCGQLSHIHTWTSQIEHLGLPCPPSVLSPPQQHLSHPARLSLADQDCHELQESPGYQGDQCTDWEGSCCLLTGWKDGLGGGGLSAAGATAWAKSLQCHGWERRQKHGDITVYKQVCGGVTPQFELNRLWWDNSDQIKQKCTTNAPINITSNPAWSDYRSRKKLI